MLTLGSILLLAQVKIGRLWALWPIVLGVAMSAMIVQALTVTSWLGIQMAGVVLLAISVGVANEVIGDLL